MIFKGMYARMYSKCLGCWCSVWSQWSTGYDQRRDQRLATIDVINVPARMGSHLSRATR